MPRRRRTGNSRIVQLLGGSRPAGAAAEHRRLQPGRYRRFLRKASRRKARLISGFVRESAQHMAALIDALLTVRVGRAGNASRAARSCLHRARCVRAFAKTLDPGRSVDRSFRRKWPGDADPILLEIVFDNLLGNAWKFTFRVARSRISRLPDLSRSGQQVPLVCPRRRSRLRHRLAGKLSPFFSVSICAARICKAPVSASPTIGPGIRRHGGNVWGEGEVGRGPTFTSRWRKPL